MMNDCCPRRNNIECSHRGALIFCKSCGFYPPEERNRKEVMRSYSAEIEERRKHEILQLDIKHKKRQVFYNIRRVRKRTK